MPTFNGRRFIDEALLSALGQEGQDIEVIVSDSGSTDGTLESVRRVAAEHGGAVRVLPGKTPGMVRNWNAAAAEARGDYLKFLFQDDALEAGCVKAMVDLAMRDRRIGLVFCRRKIVVDQSAEGTFVARWYREHEDLTRGLGKLRAVQEGRQLLASRALLDEPLNKIGEPTAVLIRKDAFERAGWFDEGLRQLVDWELWLRLMAGWRVGYIDEALVRFRVHDRQASSVNARTNAAHGEEEEVLRRMCRPGISRWLHPGVKIELRERLLPMGERAPGIGMGARVYSFARSAFRAGKRVSHAVRAPVSNGKV